MVRIAAISLTLLVGACEVFSGTAGRPDTALSESEFVEVYVGLVKATTPAAKAQVLQQHRTTEKELRDFMRAYAANLPALSAVFDSIVARQGTAAGLPDIPRLNRN